MLIHMVFDCVSLLTTNDTLHQWMTQFLVPHHPIKKKKSNYESQADKAITESERIMNSPGWAIESKDEDDVIYCKTLPQIGKVFKYEGVIEMDPESLNNKLFFNVDKSTEWNRNLLEAKVIQQINKQTNIAYFILKKEFIVQNRDFVHLRTFRKRGNSFFVSSFSVQHPDMPPAPSYTRAEHKFCTYYIQPLKDDPRKSYLIWLMQVNFHGWIPQNVVDLVVSIGMLRHINDLRSLARKP
ncbi:steroidogenic acute regulatory protein, mitochondrial isoform X1 [Parasteatoda tepidariorum]|uniref:steroidogenic acute regulatory protein, mitochondrial isoform X1 n=2 Tax=Parasteatoda tepidariorum TaxID=114398 RepID=UPI001C72296D|nr:steroidogenic acute regulatory protein, mitochondrial isoform X1 [Parasteatoda tepidariorum]